MQDKVTRITLFWFGTIMAAAFLCCGFLFLLTDFLIDKVGYPNRTYLGIVMLLYAGFRGSRQYVTYKRIQRGQDEA